MQRFELKPRPNQANRTTLLILALVAVALLSLHYQQANRDGCDGGVCPAPIRSQPGPDVRTLERRLQDNADSPPMDLPRSLREQNWGGGSCVHASTVMCLRWQGLEDVAAMWRRTYSGGESLSGLLAKLERNGLRYAYTGRDPAFLEWASRTRRGAVIFYFPNHSICFAGYSADGRTAILLDNNRIGQFLSVPKDEFVRSWQGYGGVAVTPVYSPEPPAPYLDQLWESLISRL